MKENKAIHEEIVCAGFGGQGIMIMGRIIIEAAMKEGYNVTGLPSYGAEVRGGTAHAMLHVANEEISATTVTSPTIGVVMNKPSLDKFMGKLRKNGLLIVNTSMAGGVNGRKDIKVIKLPLTELASELGSVKAANMIAVGAFTKLTKLFSLKTVLETLEEVLASKKTLLDINRKAIELGYDKV